MPGPWHWKHFVTTVSLPGASGNPGGAFCCAAAQSGAKSRTTRKRILLNYSNESDPSAGDLGAGAAFLGPDIPQQARAHRRAVFGGRRGRPDVAVSLRALHGD